MNDGQDEEDDALAGAGALLLTARERAVLADAATHLLDECLPDLIDIMRGSPRVWPEVIPGSTIADCLPTRYLPQYIRTPGILRQWFFCLSAVSWRFAQPAWLPLCCVAEQLALHAVIRHAETLLELRRDDPEGWREQYAPLYAMGEEDEDERIDFDAFYDLLFRDTDFLYLFDTAWDGIEDTPVGRAHGMESLRLADWFRPFAVAEGVVGPHPSAHDVTAAAGPLMGEGAR